MSRELQLPWGGVVTAILPRAAVAGQAEVSTRVTAQLLAASLAPPATVCKAPLRQAMSNSADYAEDLKLGSAENCEQITCSNPDAQLWFSRGVVWASGYHMEEAAYCFVRAIEADNDCAMAHWGLAYVNGPDYNFHQVHLS